MSHPNALLNQAQPPLVTRRALLAMMGAGAATALSGCMGDSSYSLDRETLTQWAVRAAALEAGGVYTAEQPGKWMGKEGAHAPSAELMVMEGAPVVRAFVNHVMTPEHWISGVYFRDQNQNIFFMQELAYTDGDPGVEKGVTVYAQVPEGVTSVTAYAYCNLHDCWMGAPLSVAVVG